MIGKAMVHSNVINIMECSVRTTSNRHEAWIVMELCHNGSLLRWNDRGYFRSDACSYEGGVDVGLVIEMSLQIAKGIAYLHSCDVIHGDLNCDNVGLNKEFVPKIMDFGLSRLYTGKAITEEGAMHGTVTHMPPELLSENIVTKSLDVYSFGVMLYEMYTGRRAWAGMRGFTVQAQILLGRRLEMPDHTPEPLKSLATNCMHADHTRRPLMNDVVNSLQTMLDDVTDKGGLRSASFKVYG
jgi:serine/threonine protein kinase